MRKTKVIGMLALAGSFVFVVPAHALDDEDAKSLFKKNDCVKCHAPEKEKRGPSLKKMAGALSGKADAETRLIKGMQSTEKVKLSDGSEETHKPVDSKDPAAQKNLARWIMTFQ